MVSIAMIAAMVVVASQDCDAVPAGAGSGGIECWTLWPMISAAELSRLGYSMSGASTLAVTSENERVDGGSAFYEISYWEGDQIGFQCRSLFRDSGQTLLMTSSRCYSTSEPFPVDQLWRRLRERSPQG